MRRRLTGSWLVVLTATLIFIPLAAHSHEVADQQTDLAPDQVVYRANADSLVLRANTFMPYMAAIAIGGETRRVTRPILAALEQATHTLQRKVDTAPRNLSASSNIPAFLSSKRISGGFPCTLLRMGKPFSNVMQGVAPDRIAELPTYGASERLDARLRHRGPPANL